MQESWAARRGERSGLIKKAGRQLIASSAGFTKRGIKAPPRDEKDWPTHDALIARDVRWQRRAALAEMRSSFGWTKVQ